MPARGLDELSARLERVQSERFHTAALEAYNAYGTAIGPRVRQKNGGERGKGLCLRVFVDEKTEDQKALGARFLPRKLPIETTNGTVHVAIDICQMSRPRLQRIDYSQQITAYDGLQPADDLAPGTLGGWAWDKSDESLVMLSNAHVLGTTPGRLMVQTDKHIGRIKRGFLEGNVDAAIADPDPGAEFDPRVKKIGPAVFATNRAHAGWEVEKFGQATNHRLGVVDATHYQLPTLKPGVAMKDGFAVRPLQEKWTDNGDSGGLVFRCGMGRDEGVQEVLGLHWGIHDDPRSGGPGLGLTCHIDDVFSALELESLAERPFTVFIETLFHSDFPDPPFEFLALRREPGVVVSHDPALGRDLFSRMRDMREAGVLTGLFRAHRVALLRALVGDFDLRAALARALHPLLKGAASIDDVLARPLEPGATTQLLALIQRLGADVKAKHALMPIARALEGADGLPLGEVLRRLPLVKRPKVKK